MTTKFNIGDETNIGTIKKIVTDSVDTWYHGDKNAIVGYPAHSVVLKPKTVTITQAEYDALLAVEGTMREWAYHLVGSYPTRSGRAQEQLYDVERARANKN